MINGLPQKLQKLRLQYGYSQKQVAGKLGLSPSIVSGYETGERTPSADVLLSISYLYNCSVDYLLGRQLNGPSTVIDISGLTNEQVQAIHTIIEAFRYKKP